LTRRSSTNQYNTIMSATKHVTFQLAPQAESCALGAGVDCAGPDTGSAEHDMALGIDSLPTKRPFARPSEVVAFTQIDARPPTRSYTFIDQNDTLRCVLEGQMELHANDIDFYGIIAKRKATGMDVVLTLRLKPLTGSSVEETDEFLVRMLDEAINMFSCAASRIAEL